MSEFTDGVPNPVVGVLAINVNDGAVGNRADAKEGSSGEGKHSRGSRLRPTSGRFGQ